MPTLKQLKAKGFDLSTQDKHSIRHLNPRCSRCVVSVINGVPTHERGCPHIVHECRGCRGPVSRAGGYCADCL